ncbi:MAG: hypothetical protein Phog2KO_17390 [Phototrophicaceae bacterium]
MSINEEINQDAKLWQNYLLSWTDSQQSLMRLFHGLSDRIEFMRDQFEENAHHPILWDMMAILPSTELIQLLDILVHYGAHPSWGFGDNVANTVRRIPQPWLVDKIWDLTLPYLDENDPNADEHIWGLLALYSEIDLDLTAKLAKFASETNNKNIAEAGDAWLAKIKNDLPLV